MVFCVRSAHNMSNCCLVSNLIPHIVAGWSLSAYSKFLLWRDQDIGFVSHSAEDLGATKKNNVGGQPTKFTSITGWSSWRLHTKGQCMSIPEQVWGRCGFLQWWCIRTFWQHAHSRGMWWTQDKLPFQINCFTSQLELAPSPLGPSKATHTRSETGRSWQKWLNWTFVKGSNLLQWHYFDFLD